MLTSSKAAPWWHPGHHPQVGEGHTPSTGHQLPRVLLSHNLLHRYPLSMCKSWAGRLETASTCIARGW